MASRGAMVAGSSGADYEHREQVAAQYHISAVNKSRLRSAMFFHCALTVLLLMKVGVDLLDRLDIFILEIEELQIPKPRWWEWWWLSSVLAAPLGLSAVKRNSILRMRRYCLALLMLGVVPALGALAAAAPELYEYATADEPDVQMWQGLPICGIWLVWVSLAAQVLGFQLLFARRLLAAWRRRRAQ
ncbi:hypothetical protein JYU34_004850 [Plutella xylostella]|uniref:Uncharacterized protein n=2 Tax=Plutella xylostella TaxID=51655 RepID=A0ABQ7QVB4_PLUXY|nr:protein jagunal [Plutella xylostella]KAG7308992.1 hypothetical protein JYU34_004850 [Plutella xylostella]CAG9135757.1 unnamed protein product [Plutella xylostella]